MNAKIEQAASDANGNRKHRTLNRYDMDRFEALLSEHADNSEVKVIRVYSSEGFVAKGYKYRADISALQATRNDSGEWEISGLVVDAHRGFGSGHKVTINGRGI